MIKMIKKAGSRTEVPGQGRKAYWHVCLYCKTKFYSRTKTSKFCSTKCNCDSKKKRVESKNCLICQTEIKIKGSYHLKNAKYCSKDCASIGKKIRPLKDFSGTCECCGKFFVYSARNDMKRRFCTKQCSGSGNATKINKARKEKEIKQELTKKEAIAVFISRGEKIKVIDGCSHFNEEIKAFLSKGGVITRLPFIKEDLNSDLANFFCDIE